mgnify:CR=1 FL=1
MELISVRELFKNTEKYADQTVTIGGWVRNRRPSKQFGFIVLNDGTTIESTECQMTLKDMAENSDTLGAGKYTYYTLDWYWPFETGDDAICLKAGKDREARKQKKPCENVLSHNCRGGSGFGGFVIGSEMSRGVHNVLIRDCMFNILPLDNAPALKRFAPLPLSASISLIALS